MNAHVMLVGCGNMGHAMLTGWLKAGRLPASDVVVVEPIAEFRQRAAALGVTAVDSPHALANTIAPVLIVLAVKPQLMREVVPDYRRFTTDRTAFLSIAAGTTIATLEELLGEQTGIVRCMPNTPAALGHGMMVTVANGHVGEDVKSFVADLLSANGAVAAIDDEKLMDAVTAVSGSGPAYVFHFIECLATAAKSAGLPKETAALLAMQTVYGAASLARESGEDPAKLREQVTSPNGTTAAALSVLLTRGRLETLVCDAVMAAIVRSIELGR